MPGNLLKGKKEMKKRKKWEKNMNGTKKNNKNEK